MKTIENPLEIWYNSFAQNKPANGGFYYVYHTTNIDVFSGK
jgi:hypothetical protein